MQDTKNITSYITPDMQKMLKNLNKSTREKIVVLETTYMCKCGQSTYNDAMIKVAGEMLKMPSITECPKCKKRHESKEYKHAKAEDKKAFCLAGKICAERIGRYYHGSFGTGKTHLAKQLCKAAKKQHRTAKFTTPQSIQQSFNDCIGSETYEYQVLLELAHVDLLIIDDIGQEQVTERGLSQLWQVINARYEYARPTVYTSNYTLDELTKRYSKVNRTQAESICSRIRGNCIETPIDGEDRRKQAMACENKRMTA